MEILLLVDLVALLLAGFIVWWFWLYKPRAANRPSSTGAIEITVADGIYEPDVIEWPAGKPLSLHFRRLDPSPCAEIVQFDRLDISAELAVNEVTPVNLPPMVAGEYPFSCQMQMYRGRLLITAEPA